MLLKVDLFSAWHILMHCSTSHYTTANDVYTDQQLNSKLQLSASGSYSSYRNPWLVCFLPYRSQSHRRPRLQRRCLQQLKTHRTGLPGSDGARRLCSTPAELILPFSHLTSPSVTDSANAGVFTVITSFPAITEDLSCGVLKLLWAAVERC